MPVPFFYFSLFHFEIIELSQVNFTTIKLTRTLNYSRMSWSWTLEPWFLPFRGFYLQPCEFGIEQIVPYAQCGLFSDIDVDGIGLLFSATDGNWDYFPNTGDCST